MPDPELAAALAAYGEVTGLRRLPGGASRETYAFDAGDRPLILRRDSPASPDAAAMAREAALLAAADAAGVPVPRLVDNGPALLGVPYLIMERLPGETIPRRLLRDARFAAVRPRLARELGRILARLHTIPPAAVPGLPDGDPLTDLTERYAGFDEPRPAVELALRWLDRHRPAPAPRRAVVHGDFRTGNLLIDETGVRGVLDWELSHLGDPAEDLGWLCVKAWRFSSPHPAGGFGSRADLLAGYAEAGGAPPDAAALRWWEVYGTLRWAVLCRHQAGRFLDGSDASIEFAVLGRRVCEQEHDLLLALGLTAPVTVPDPLDAAASAGGVPRDRPNAATLLDAASGAGAVPPHDRPDTATLLDAASSAGWAPHDQPDAATLPDAASSAGGTPPHDRPDTATLLDTASSAGGAPPHDGPNAAALIDAVGAFLDGTRHPDERVRYHTRVASAALRIARRELLLGDAHRAAHQTRLRALGCADDADLASAIRTGALDARMDEVVAAVRASVVDKVTVANPRHLALPG